MEDMDDGYTYNKWAVVDNKQGSVLQLSGWAKA